MTTRAILVLAVTLSALAGCGDVTAPSTPPPAGSGIPSPAAGGIEVLFKVDPRIARALYLGDRWVAPPYLRVGEGEQVTVEARAIVLDAAGRPTAMAPAWQPSDLGMVTVAPATGNEVNVTVKRAGESRLVIAVPGVSQELTVRATYPRGVIQVEILSNTVTTLANPSPLPLGQLVLSGAGWRRRRGWPSVRPSLT